MISRTPSLAEWPYRMVRLARDHCPRRGQYRKDTLLSVQRILKYLFSSRGTHFAASTLARALWPRRRSRISLLRFYERRADFQSNF
jgi:hypothetical protein